MGDDLRNFDREYETFGSSGGLVVDRARRMASVEGRVHFDCGKLSRIVREKMAWLHARWIERTFPARRREGRSAEKNSWQRKRAVNCERVCKLACLLQFLHLEECRVANRLHFGTLGAHRSERLTSFVLQSCPCLGENSVCSERASTGTGTLGTSSYSVDPKCFRMRTMWVARVAQTERATALLRGRKSNPSRCFGCAYDFRAILGLCQTSRGPEFSGNPVLSGKRGRPG